MPRDLPRQQWIHFPRDHLGRYRMPPLVRMSILHSSDRPIQALLPPFRSASALPPVNAGCRLEAWESETGDHAGLDLCVLRFWRPSRTENAMLLAVQGAAQVCRIPDH
jgi:hypothetical protein